MKKGLSVLLVVAALFGFYGGATNLNDVLACKDYWEEEGERSTADMNKLEDGLNQLKDNEEAYLDGLDQVADGEQELADGEAKLADGEAQYAKGLADYAAAPGKLAAGRKKLAAGEASLAEAIANRAKLQNVKNKIDKVETAYKPWLQKFNKLVGSIVQYEKDGKTPKSGVMYDVGAVAVALTTGTEEQPGLLASINGINTMAAQAEGGAAQYKAGMDAIVAGVKAKMPEGTSDDDVIAFIKAGKAGNAEDGVPYKDKYEGAEKKYDEYTKLAGTLKTVYSYLNSTYSGRITDVAQSINGKIEKVQKADYQATQLRNSDFTADMSDAEALLNDLASDQVLAQAATAQPELAQKLMGGVQKIQGMISDAKSSLSDYNKGYDELKPSASMGKNIGSKVADAAKAILSNKDISGKMTGTQKSALKPYMSSSSITGLPNIELLYGTMTLGKDKEDDGKNSLLDSLRALKAGATGGIGQYDDGIADGEDQLADGRAELAKGIADYKAAPGKLADARQQLADGRQALADGRTALAEGKAKLAEYEDGEQQVRDGLATLMATEANGGLESILDRRSGDDDFDNGDKHLDLDEGLDAVGVGRGYQADSGELITKEITGRAVGTAALLGAGALAVLAAILSFLKKNKGAGVFAILSAAAGAFGAFYGTSAGTEFSSIAGSAVGATGWVAAGILAAVALVHAIAHFSAKPEA